MKQFLATLLVIAVVFPECKKDRNQPTVPTLTTSAVTNISFNTASTGGVITSDGGAAITESGIVWSKTNSTPTSVDSIKTGTATSGSFTSVLNNLEENKTYYVRAYAKNSVGAGYGNVITFNTSVDTTKVTFTYNGATVTYGVITSSVTGRKWMDRNLGASRTSTALDDYLGYGDKFQWGRPADGHQLMTYTSSATGTAVNGQTTTLATSDAPGHALFITPVYVGPDYYTDWRDDRNNNRWALNSQGPCPSGWHVPTKDEWQAETGITNATTAFDQLKITRAGYRRGINDGSGDEGTLKQSNFTCRYWSSSIAPSGLASTLNIVSTFPSSIGSSDRSTGCSVRCIKN